MRQILLLFSCGDNGSWKSVLIARDPYVPWQLSYILELDIIDLERKLSNHSSCSYREGERNAFNFSCIAICDCFASFNKMISLTLLQLSKYTYTNKVFIWNPKQTSICEQPNRTSIRYEYVFIVLRNVNLKFLVYFEDDDDDTIRKKGYKHNGVYILAHKKLHKLN